MGFYSGFVGFSGCLILYLLAVVGVFVVFVLLFGGVIVYLLFVCMNEFLCLYLSVLVVFGELVIVLLWVVMIGLVAWIIVLFVRIYL